MTRGQEKLKPLLDELLSLPECDSTQDQEYLEVVRSLSEMIFRLCEERKLFVSAGAILDQVRQESLPKLQAALGSRHEAVELMERIIQTAAEHC